MKIKMREFKTESFALLLIIIGAMNMQNVNEVRYMSFGVVMFVVGFIVFWFDIEVNSK